MQRIRWRLLVGVVSLGAAVGATLPAAASTVDLGQRLAQLTPSEARQVADVIWPNGAELMDIIWPNASVLGSGLGNTDQNSQGNQDTQN